MFNKKVEVEGANVELHSTRRINAVSLHVPPGAFPNKMDCLPYCIKSNLVSYWEFIDDLKTKDLIFIGEDHFDPVCKENEEVILKELSKAKRFNIAVEHLSYSLGYQPTWRMITRFASRDILFLPFQNRPMVESLESIISKEITTIAIVGFLHLKDCRSVDALFRENHPDVSSVVIVQENNDSLPQGIYGMKTPPYQDYILAGKLPKPS